MTFSITAYDPETGAMGVATMTGSVAVGALVPHCRSGNGAIATQGLRTNWLYGERGLEMLSQGFSAQHVIDSLVNEDEGRDYRQCIIVDRIGRTSHWTGKHCEQEYAVAAGESCIAAGNWLADKKIPQYMIEVFEKNKGLSFSSRLLKTLEAGEERGGDARGSISAALIVDFKSCPPINLRIDNQASGALNSLKELHQIYCKGAFKDFYESLPTRENFSR